MRAYLHGFRSSEKKSFSIGLEVPVEASHTHVEASSSSTTNAEASKEMRSPPRPYLNFPVVLLTAIVAFSPERLLYETRL